MINLSTAFPLEQQRKINPDMSGLRKYKNPIPCIVVLLLSFFCNLSYAEEASLWNRLFGKKNDNAEEVQTITDPVSYTVTFDIESKNKENKNLDSEIKKASLLDTQTIPPSGTFSLLKRANSDQERLVKALNALGFYNGQIFITIAGLAIDNQNVIERMDALHTRKEAIPVKVTIRSGELFSIASAQIRLSHNPPEYTLPEMESLGLSLGSAAKSLTVLEGEKKILADARRQGYAFAEITNRDILVDHKTRTMQIVFSLNPGKKAYFGQTTVSGGENLPGFIEKRIPWHEGEDFSPTETAKLRASLQKYNVFSSIRIEADHSDKTTGKIPVSIEVEERPARYIGFGTKFSSTEGASLNTYWGHRNLFGGAEHLRIQGEILGAPLDSSRQIEKINTKDQIGYRLSASLTIPDVFSIKDEVTIIPAYFRDITEYYTREGFSASATYRYQYSDALRLEGGLDIERAQIKRFHDPSFPNNQWYTLVGIPFTMSYDKTDNLLDPTSGYRLSGTLEPFIPIGESPSMLLMKGAFSTYLPLDDDKRFVLAGRISTGAITGAAINEIPPSRRFFSGGSSSVRGYDYRSLGPKNINNWVTGGRSYFDASAELRIKMTDTIGLVTFIDAGNAFLKEYPDFSKDLRYSAGIGLRYHTPVGPLRLDIARGFDREADDPKFAIYVSIGQAF